MVQTDAITKAIAAVAGQTVGSVDFALRALRPAGLVNSSHSRAGRSNPRDVAKLLIAIASRTKYDLVHADLQRSAGLVVTVQGREITLPGMVEMLLAELVDGSDLGGVVDLWIAVSRPWPSACVTMKYGDGQIENIVFEHRESRGADTATAVELAKRWNYVPGSPVEVTVLKLSALRRLAAVIKRQPTGRAKGRLEEIEHLDEPVEIDTDLLPFADLAALQARAAALGGHVTMWTSGPPPAAKANR